MEISEIADLGKLVSSGGAVALAVMVWLELREHRKELAYVKEVMSELGKTLTAILERDRDTAIKDFIKEEISGVHAQPSVIVGPDEVTPVDSPRLYPRARSPQPGQATLPYGPMKPGASKGK